MDSRESPAPPQQPPAPPSQPPGMMVPPPPQPNSYPPNNNTSPMINPNSATTIIQNPRFFNSVSNPAPYADGSQPLPSLKPAGFSIEPAKKKRGRPRKYSPDGNIALGLNPTPALVTPVSAVAQGESGNATPSSDTPAKRSRGRPPGTGKKQLNALGSSGVGFTPHVILVNTGEDIASKIMAFSQQGPRTVCILSANGAISNVTLRQTATSGANVTYEGRYEIISLTGSFLLSESNGSRSRTGGLSVSLAGSDGRVLGGGVAGMLTAATPVQVIVGSFVEDGKKPKSVLSSPPPANMLNLGAPVAAVSPTSQGASSESSDDSGGSPHNQGVSGLYNNASQSLHNVPMYSNMAWANSTAKML